MIPAMFERMKQEEGYRQFVYNDSRGIPTVGYGRNLRSVGISQGEAEMLYQNDIDKVEFYLESFDWYNALDPVRRAVIANMAFNMGSATLFTFYEFLGFVKAGNYNAAATDMLNTLWASEVGQRAVFLSDVMRNGAIS